MIKRWPWPLSFEFTKEPLLWAAAGILSFILFLFVTFPFDALQARILAEITRATGCELRAGDWSVGLPLAVEWHDLVLSKQDTLSVPVDSMRIGIGLMAQLAGRAAVDAMFHFPGSGQRGAARATATITSSSWSFEGPTVIKTHAQQIDLASLLKPYVAKGWLQADITQAWVGNPGGGVTFKGDGSWKAEVRDLTLEHIPAGAAQLPSLTFTRVTLAVACRDAQCDVTELRGEGPDGTITGQGRLQLQEPLPQSTMELTLTILAGSGWAQKSAGLPIPPLPPGTPLTVKLGGSVANPRLSV